MEENSGRGIILKPRGVEGLPDFFEVVMMLDDIRLVLKKKFKRMPTMDEVAEALCGPALVELRKGLIELELERKAENEKRKDVPKK